MRKQLPLLLILLLAAVLRLHGIVSISPPGPSHDETANWLIDRSILDENRIQPYFTEAYGHEAGFHYLQAAAIALIGDNLLALRLPAAFAGLLGIAAAFHLARLLFGRRPAIWSASLLAVLFCSIFFSRQGLRAILLPLISTLSASSWFFGWRQPPASTKARYGFLLAGFLAGLSLYTYLAARAVPIFYLLFLLYLVLFHTQKSRQHGRNLLFFFLALIVTAAPLSWFLYNSPDAEFRISEVDAPLQAVKEGNLLPVWQNSLRIGSGFLINGDPLWRQNIPQRPFFDPLTAVAFYGGILLALFRWRDERYTFLLLWLGCNILPSVATIDAPSQIRMINILPVVTLLPALFIHNWATLSTSRPLLSTYMGNKSVNALFIGVVILNALWAGRDILLTWPAADEVRFVWQSALTETGRLINQLPETDATAVGGWTPESMDHPTMQLTAGSKATTLRHFYPPQGIILPAGAQSTIYYPTLLRPPMEIEMVLANAGGIVINEQEIKGFQFTQPAQIIPQIRRGGTFNEELELLGYTLYPTENESVSLTTFWRVLAAPNAERRLFIHLLDPTGELLGQSDGLSAPARFWQRDDLLIQYHLITYDQTANPYIIRIGAYDPATGQRLLLPDEQDHLNYLLNQ